MNESLEEYRFRKIKELLPEAVAMAQREGAIRISVLQRTFRIGYTLAAAIVDEMQRSGLVGLLFDQAAYGFPWIGGTKNEALKGGEG